MRTDVEIRVKIGGAEQSTPANPGVVIKNGNSETSRWEMLDMKRDPKFQIQIVNNLFTPISTITSSSTLSIKLPKTVHNDMVFDFACKPNYESGFPYKWHECRCYINGIDILGEAYMALLSVAEDYEVVIVFGLLQNYKQWISDDKSLRELPNNQECIEWNWRAAYIFTPPAFSPHDTQEYPPIWYGDDPASYNAQNGLSKAMYFGIYNPGDYTREDSNVDVCNIHPFVTLREIWERIIHANNLDFVLPLSVLRDMEDLALVLTHIDGNEPQGIPVLHPIEYNGDFTLTQIGSTFYFYPELLEEDYTIKRSQYLSVLSHGNGRVTLYFNMMFKGNDVGWLMDRLNNDTSKMRLYLKDLVTGEEKYIEPLYSTTGRYLIYIGNMTLKGSENTGEEIGRLYMKMPTAGTGGYTVMNNYLQDFEVTNGGEQHPLQVMDYTTYSGTYDYPNKFNLIPNLPDISQIDFVKAVCELYGLFPMLNVEQQGRIDFISFDELENKIWGVNCYDWSNKLLQTNSHSDAPETMDFSLDDFARKNRIAYKDDPKDHVKNEDFLIVDDDTLKMEKDLVIFPWAATNGNTIPQYKLKNEQEQGYSLLTADFTECEYRLMRVTEWFNYGSKAVTRLAFKDLSAQQITSKYYTTYTEISRKPKVIKEQIRLNELDIKHIDLARSVYLSKYGRFFAIKSILFEISKDSNSSEVELIMVK